MLINMAEICPTVMGSSNQEYQAAIQRISGFAHRIHIDFADGVFAPTKLIPIEDAWWPVGHVIDFHVMYQKPLDHLEDIIHHSPHLVIVHAEAEGAEEFIKEIDGLGIKKGVALLKDTSVDKIKGYIDELDHVLIFSGDLGHYGGTVDLGLLDKIKELKLLNPDLEVGWDGGVNEETVKDLVKGGVDVLNVGGAIQKAQEPEAAYDTLMLQLS